MAEASARIEEERLEARRNPPKKKSKSKPTTTTTTTTSTAAATTKTTKQTKTKKGRKVTKKKAAVAVEPPLPSIPEAAAKKKAEDETEPPPSPPTIPEAAAKEKEEDETEAPPQSPPAIPEGVSKNEGGKWVWEDKEMGEFLLAEEAPTTWKGDSKDGRSLCFEMNSTKEKKQAKKQGKRKETAVVVAPSSPPQPPSDEMVGMMADILEKSENLETTIGKKLWDDWHGKFKGTSCWWQDDLTKVKENYGKEMPKSSKDLQKKIKLNTIHVVEDYPETYFIGFDCGPLDEEQGQGACFSKNKLVGFAYSYEMGGHGLVVA